jgi:hypothetical protein
MNVAKWHCRLPAVLTIDRDSVGTNNVPTLRSLPRFVIASCLYRRGRYCSRTMNGILLENSRLKVCGLVRPSAIANAQSCHREEPEGRRGDLDLTTLIRAAREIASRSLAMTGMGFMERRASPDEEVRFLPRQKSRSLRRKKRSSQRPVAVGWATRCPRQQPRRTCLVAMHVLRASIHAPSGAMIEI